MEDSKPCFLPSLFVRGTFYQVGYDMGKTFKDMIAELVQLNTYLTEDLVPAYNTEKGRRIYEDTLQLVTDKFPHYIRELQGIADGSQVPFHLLMLLHVDNMILADSMDSMASGFGCSSIMCNQEDVILGHTEDAVASAKHRCYVVHADITDTIDGVEHREKFSSLCYAGHLPGFCMSVNHHGFVYSINVIEAARRYGDRIPRHFLTRALLAARDLNEAEKILRNPDISTALGFCVNMAFMNEAEPLTFYSAEVGPAEVKGNPSRVSILTVSKGESHIRCNSFLRLNIEQKDERKISSNCRLREMHRIGLPHTMADMAKLLSDQSNPDYPVHRCGTAFDPTHTIATGFFNFKTKKWLFYVEKPEFSTPIASFPLDI